MAASLPIYMDYQATTPLDGRVLQAMLPFFSKHFGNAASTEHRFGWEAEEAVAQARAKVCNALNASHPREIIFTSGATEANNLAILGALRAYRRKGNHLVTVCTEHKAVLDPCRWWEKEGGKVTYLPVDTAGLVTPEQVEAALRPETVMISVMLANNEIGVIQPLSEIGAIARRTGVLFHSDAAQAVGKVPVDVAEMGIHLLSVSAHKFYGPKGVGALYVRGKNPRVALQPLVYGGGHERGLRSGTLNVAGIVGLGKAMELAMAEMEDESKRLLDLRNRLWRGLQGIPGILMNGDSDRRLPGNLNISLPGIDNARLIREIYSDLAVSSGAACTSASPEPSHVLRALPDGETRASSCLRLGLGRFSTEEEVDFAAGRIARAFRALSA